MFINSRIRNVVNKIENSQTKLKFIDKDIQKFFDEENYHECFVHSLTIRNVVKKCILYLKSCTTPNLDIITLSNFLCNKLYNIFKLSSEYKSIVREKLQVVVKECNDIILPIRLSYFKFSDGDIVEKISKWLFNNNIQENIQMIGYLQIMKYLLRVTQDLRLKENILLEYERIFTDPQTTLKEKMEIADTFILVNLSERGNEMLNIIRDEQRRLEELQQDRLRRSKTVYSDPQNVHDTNINRSVLQAAFNLIKHNISDGFDSDDVISQLSTDNISSDKINHVLQRIEIDTSLFSYENSTFTLYDVFSSLWKYINKHQYKKELFLRLLDEINEMDGYCSTGHLSRLVNVIQGFTEDDNLQIRVSDRDQIISVIRSFLDRELMNCDNDRITDSLLEDDKTPFYIFIRDSINDKMKDLVNEYGDVTEYIVQALNMYTNTNIWNVNDSVVTFNM